MPKNKVSKSFYAYSVNFAALLFGTNATLSFNIEADANFKLEQITYFSNIANATQTDATRVVPLISLLITNTASGRQFMDSAQPINNIAGTGDRPFILPQPKIFPARSTVQILGANFSAATDYNTVISFIGTKVYVDPFSNT